MTGFQGSDIVFDQAAKANHLDGVGAQALLSMVAQGNVKKDAGEEENDHHAGSGTGEKFEMEMALTKQPASGFAEGAGGTRLDQGLGSLLLLAHL